MDLMLFIRVLLRRWWLVLIPIAITGALALQAYLTPTPASAGGYNTTFRYSAAQNLEAIPRSEGDYQDIWLSSELVVNALTDWITSSSFADEAAALLNQRGTQITAAALVGRFAADNERSVGVVSISWANADELAQIADAAIEVLSNRNAVYFAQLGGTPATVTLLDAPSVNAAPPPLVDRFGPLLRVGIGALAGVGLAILAHVLDPLLRRRDEVEALGLSVISSIPKH
jgi:capsular polysaccharide biosynthesis protein